MDLPERLKRADDASEDVTAPSKDGPARYMNQSIFSMITAAGSTNQRQTLLDDGLSDSDGNDDVDQPQFLTTDAVEPDGDGPAEPRDIKHSRTSSKNKLLSKLRLNTGRSDGHPAEADDMTGSQILNPKSRIGAGKAPAGSDASTLRRRVTTEVDRDISEEDQGPQKAPKLRRISAGPSSKRPMLTLPAKLMEIFRFDEPEEVILEAKCWLLQSVLLMGYMYVTPKHICFYAYLPKRAAAVSKSGYLSKQGKRNPRYRRLYFELKGDVLSYYESPANKYYPQGSIDLRNAISAAVVEPTDKNQTTAYFTVQIEGRTYSFKADTMASAKEWVKNIQRAIFRSNNEGDAVKISLPIENIMDIEENPILDCAETVKIRVIDNDETYAIDEVR